MKYCEEIIQAFEKAILSGLSNKRACNLLCIAEPTFYDWMGTRVDFSKRIRKAETEKIQRLLGIIEGHAIKNWQPAEWLLERCHPTEYALHTYQDVEQRVTQQKEKLEQMSDDKLEVLIAECDMEVNKRYVSKELTKSVSSVRRKVSR